jgi:hypothetical protein
LLSIQRVDKSEEKEMKKLIEKLERENVLLRNMFKSFDSDVEVYDASKLSTMEFLSVQKENQYLKTITSDIVFTEEVCMI